MIEAPTISNQLTEIMKQETHEEKLIATLETYMELFPVVNAYLCRYSSIGYLGEGVVAIEDDEIKYIHKERYDVRNVPAVFAAIKEKRAQFVSGRDLFKITSSNHVLSTSVHAFLVTPIIQRSVVVGFIYSNRFANEEITENMLDCVTEFSRKVGDLIHENYAEQKLLSKREFEVMKEIANGSSTKEIAATLELSELTVKQYVKLAREKLNATNRTHAVANMYRLGIL